MRKAKSFDFRSLLLSTVSFIPAAQAQIVIKSLCDDGKWYDSCTASAGYTNPAPNPASSSGTSSSSGSSGGAALGPSNKPYVRTEPYVNTYVPKDPGPIVVKQLCDDGKWYDSCTASAGYHKQTPTIAGPSYTTKMGPNGETIYFFKGPNGENVTFTQ